MTAKRPIQAPQIRDYRERKPHPDRVELGLRINGQFSKQSSPSDPLVSIITIVRNGERTIEKTINSVLNQTYKNLEYVVIDGGSTDGTLNILKKYQDQIAYCLSEPDEGIGDAFNKGISFSTGELIGIINSDDWYCENAVETIVEKYRQFSELIYHGNNQRWNEQQEPDYIFTANDKKILNRMTINHPTVFVPRSVYEDIGLFRLDFEVAMDYEWLRRAKLYGKDFYYLNQVITNMSPGGISDAKWLKGYVENARARKLQGVNSLNCYFVLLVMLAVTFSRKGFEKVGLSRLVDFYKRHFSIVKKYKAAP
jgi:glycosyltransferase involved in cell wall biosynthesis